MTTSILARRSLSSVAAVFVALLCAGQAVAASWAAPVPLSLSGLSFAGGVVATGGMNAAAVYEDNGIIVKTTNNSGGSWGGAVKLANDGLFPQIAGLGSDVDVVWAQNQRLRYAHSANGGIAFSPSMKLSPLSNIVDDFVSVARGPGSLVVVAWTHNTNPDPFGTPDNRLRIRISTNGGTSFGAPKTLASGEVFLPAVAIGNGVIYFAYTEDQGGTTADAMKIRRSLDVGATWSAPLTLATNLFDNPILTAAGSHVYVSYSARTTPSHHWARYRRSTNNGATWSSPINLSSPSGPPSWVAEMTLKDGVVRAAFERCIPGCDYTHVFYRQSSNGTTWTPAEQVSTALGVLNWPAGVAFAGKILVAYSTIQSDGGFYAYVRAGTP